MADEKKQTETVNKADFDALMTRLTVAEAKLEAQEAALTEQPNYGGGESVTTKSANKPALTGETFTYKGEQYAVAFPVISHNARNISEAEILSDQGLQKELIEGGFKVIRKVSAIIAFLMMFVFSAGAATVTINPYSAEVITTTSTKRDFYHLQDLLMIYRSSTDGFEIQVSESRSKLWGGNIDSVLISGISNDSAGAVAKLAYLRTLLLEATTTNGYRVFIGRNNLEFYYVNSSKRTDVKYGKNKQPLWFGHLDSLKCNGATATLAYLRLISRYRAQDCLPSTSVATIAAGAAAGSSPTVSVTGDAFSGSISVTTGTTATTGVLATVTLKITAPTGTRISLTGTNANACLHAVRWHGSGTTTTLVITVPATALSDATAYTWNYTVTPY